jgi:hypothetical protein
VARRRSWSPPKHSAHTFNPVPSLAQYAGAPAPGAWSADPRAHATIYRPLCGVPACREPAMIWTRHNCRQFIARCHAHDPTDPFAAALAAHQCPGAP